MFEVSDELYEVMVNRSSRFDGEYYVGIVSTGIVCFPSCRSRLPKRENVRVYTSVAEAVAAGFRPCKRCKPDNPNRQSPDAELVNRTTAIMHERMAEHITLESLADELNVSPYHLQRTFKRFTGISPAEQLTAFRMDRAKALLGQKGASISDVAQQVGYQSNSHFASTFTRYTGTAPAEYRQQAEGVRR